MSQTISNAGAENEAALTGGEALPEDDGMDAVYRSFSCPFEPFDESFAQMIAGEYARSVIGVFVGEFGGALARGGRGVAELFSQLSESELPFDLSWSSDLGNLIGAAKLHDPEHALKAAAAFALRACAQGAAAEWELKLARPAALFWGDWVLPECDALNAASDGARAEVKLSLGGGQTNVVFTRRGDEPDWDCEADVPGVSRLQTFGSGTRRLRLLPCKAALDSGFFRDPEDAAKATETFQPEVVRTLTAALDLLEEHAPHYFEWVVRVLRRVVVFHSTQDLLLSGNHENQLGTIHISDNLRVLSVAEMFVHEASHQYLDLLTKMGPTVDPAHKQLYYSPVKQCDRPLNKILLAYHAFANVMLFYHDVRERGQADQFFEHQRNVLMDELRQLEQPLVGAEAVTPLGKGLVEPLIERGVCL